MDILKAFISRLTWRVVVYWALLFGGLWAFRELAVNIYRGQGFPFDEPILQWFYTLLNPALTQVALFLSIVGDVEPMIGLSLLVAILLWRYLRRQAVFFLLCMGGTSLLMVIAKYFFGRERPELFPDLELWQEASSSFPSGHATGSFALGLSLFLVAKHCAPRWAFLAGFFGAVWALSVSLSRLYLQVHYPSDIMAAWALATAWILGVNALHNRDRSVRNVILTLPADVVEAYHDIAQRDGLEADEVVTRALRREFSIAPNNREGEPVYRQKGEDVTPVFGETAMRQVLLYRHPQGHWAARCLSLEDCTAEGVSREETLKSIRLEIAEHVKRLESPPPETFEALLLAVPTAEGQAQKPSLTVSPAAKG